MAGRIQIEPDRQEIAALPQRYASAADRSDGVALAALFSPEGTLTIHDDPGALGPPSRSLAGRDAIASSVGTLRDRFEATFHMLGQQTARIDGMAPTVRPTASPTTTTGAVVFGGTGCSSSGTTTGSSELMGDGDSPVVVSG